MKSLFTCILICVAASQVAYAQIKNDLEVFDLKGKIKTLRIERTRSVVENGRVNEGARQPQEQINFDEKGFYTERAGLTNRFRRRFENQYYPDGKIKERADLTYSEREVFTYQKNRVERVTQRTDGHVLNRWIYTQDDNGNKIKEEYVLVDKDIGQRTLNPVDVTTYKYDPQKRLLETAYFKADGSPTIGLIFSTHKYVNSYDGKGRLSERLAYGLADVPVSKWVYKYNEKGYLEEIAVFGPTLVPLSKVTYSSFDEVGNWMESRSFNISASGGKAVPAPAESIYRTIIYYP